MLISVLVSHYCWRCATVVFLRLGNDLKGSEEASSVFSFLFWGLNGVSASALFVKSTQATAFLLHGYSGDIILLGDIVVFLTLIVGVFEGKRAFSVAAVPA